MKTMANKPNDKATHKQRQSGKRKVQDQFDKKSEKTSTHCGDNKFVWLDRNEMKMFLAF